MGACDTWNVEINVLIYENEMFSLPAQFHFKILQDVKKYFFSLFNFHQGKIM